MHRVRNTARPGLPSTAVAALLAWSLLLAGLLACLPGLHRRLHETARCDHDNCVVCQIAQGQFSAPATIMAVLPGIQAVVGLVLPARQSLGAGLMFTVVLGQGPPRGGAAL
jgi:hypothetical protein